MKVIQFTAENFKKIRLVEVAPKGRRTTFTGRNGQGKTSVLDAFWALFAGKRGIPEKPVRKGAQKSKLSAVLGDDSGKPLLVIKRLIQDDRTTTVTVEAAPGAERPAGTPQAVLDTLIGEMSFDPIAFIHLETKKQIEILRTLVKVDVDLDDLTDTNKIDYAERTIVNRAVEELRAQAAAALYSPGLPKEKVDEVEISERIAAANRANAGLAETIKFRQGLIEKVGIGRRAVEGNESTISQLHEEVEDLAEKLERAKDALRVAHEVHPKLLTNVQIAQQALDEAPAEELIDVQPLNDELATAQVTNREIDRRMRREDLDRKLSDKQAEAARLTRSIEDRDEKKREALANAQMPVEGLGFSEEGVFFKGLPLENLGEAEQIRVALGLAMASNPKLRAVPIAHGESMDDESLALIDQMAEENDFQIFMAKVDSSGAVGIVLSDGMVEKVNE
jgi:hypothetical protein